MKYYRTIAPIVFVLMPQTLIAQKFEFDIQRLDQDLSLYHATLSLSPNPSVGASENTSDNDHVVSIGFDVQLQQSNTWLINPNQDKDVDLTPEELFARDLFQARKSMSTLEVLRDLIDDNFYLEKEQQYARDDSAMERESNAFTNFVDIKLLAVVHYGNYLFFLNTLKFNGNTMPDVTSAILVRKINGKYFQSNALSQDITTTFFFAGKIKDEIFEHLEIILESEPLGAPQTSL
jgi:hypothetical protein